MKSDSAMIQRTFRGRALICRPPLHPAVELSLTEERLAATRDVIRPVVNFGREVKTSIRARVGIDKSRVAAAVHLAGI